MTAEKIYSMVTEERCYDLHFANQQQKILSAMCLPAYKLPELTWFWLQNERRGASLNFSLAMAHLLHNEGIEVYLAITPDFDPKTGKRTEMHASVCYEENKDYLFSDPFSTVKEKTKRFFNMRIKEFKSKMLLEGETISIFDLYGEDGKLFFKDFLLNPKKIF